MEEVTIVKLELKDRKIYKKLRLRALKEEPHAFGSSNEENVGDPDIAWIQRLKYSNQEKTHWLVFAEKNNIMVGMITAHLEKEPDTAHILSLYVTPEERGKGIAKNY